MTTKLWEVTVIPDSMIPEFAEDGKRLVVRLTPDPNIWYCHPNTLKWIEEESKEFNP